MQASSLSSYLSVSYTDKHFFNISGENNSLDRPNQVFQQKKLLLTTHILTFLRAICINLYKNRFLAIWFT